MSFTKKISIAGKEYELCFVPFVSEDLEETIFRIDGYGPPFMMEMDNQTGTFKIMKSASDLICAAEEEFAHAIQSNYE